MVFKEAQLSLLELTNKEARFLCILSVVTTTAELTTTVPDTTSSPPTTGMFNIERPFLLTIQTVFSDAIVQPVTSYLKFLQFVLI
jgi:hypothetical protein